MSPLIETLDIAQAREPLFALLTDLASASRVNPNLSNLQPIDGGPMRAGFRFSQENAIHGRVYRQQVLVTIFQRPERLELQRQAYGIRLAFHYEFEVLDAQRTRVTLTKRLHAPGLLRLVAPLLRHFLRRPEHDGQLLEHLRAAAAAGGGRRY